MNLLCTILAVVPLAGSPDTLSYDIPEITVSSPIKHSGTRSGQPVSASAFTVRDFEAARITEPKDLSLTVPNFIQADYGSKMTSSLYIRGIGARMEQPAVGLYIDNIPILNKNNYDLDYHDVGRLYFLRGPQGTLYGRNTIGGVIDIHTILPFERRGSVIRAGYGNGNTSEFSFSTYHTPTPHFGFSVSLNHRYSDGFFTNEYDGSAADRILSEGGRVKAVFRLGAQWTLENTLFANYVKQKGFAYSLYDEQTGARSPVNHNDPCAYERFSLIDGLTFRYEGGGVRFSSTTSYQYLDDTMTLDQDFSPASVFTLRQGQREHAATQEFMLHSGEGSRWQRITGLFGFYKHTRMDVPVTFKRDGIDGLILANANRGIQTVFPDAALEIREDSFPIGSFFKLPTFGASIYHKSTFTAGRWRFGAGIRADYERTAIDYANEAAFHYRFTLTMNEFKALHMRMDGDESKDYFEFMPHVSAVYEIGAGSLYASVARGYKSGGYNTQIFSDIMQNRMMSGLMSDLGLHVGGGGAGYDAAEAISYKPEYSWNYEIGAHLASRDKALNVDAAVFYIDLRDQQLTVFPPGQTTGRMMSNAGRSRSFGAELSVSYRAGRFNFAGSYGHTNAKFSEYVSGGEDYSGKYIPYVPQNTVYAMCEYRQPFAGKRVRDVVFNLNWQGAGRFHWNEANTVSQRFYGLLNASATVNAGKFSATLWGRNLAGTDYDTFYFKSVGRSFVQRGKPFSFGVSVNIRL